MNVVQISADASVDTDQDLLFIVLSATKEGTDANLVQSQLKQSIESALLIAKKRMDPAAMDVRTGQFRLFPRYGKDGKISGWQGQAEIVLEGKDFARISTVAGEISTMTVSQTGFGLSRPQRMKVEEEAQATAIQRFRDKAKTVSKSFGFEDSSIREVSVNLGENVRPMANMMSSRSGMAVASVDSPVPVQPGKTSVSVTVSGSVQMR